MKKAEYRWQQAGGEDPVAIIGIGCRFPGGSHSPKAYWDMLAEGRDGIVEVPKDRWNLRKFYDPNPDKPGKMYVRAGGFVQQRIDEFDALFFGIAPREAETVDPQQRLLLEVAWESLEDAGLDHEALAGSDTGVYVGGFMLDNMINRMSPHNRHLIGVHTAVSSTLSILSNRLSYVFDLRGPNVGMDTACSSSLVAIHHACQGLRRGECSLALAGGVNVMYKPENPISMCKGGFLAKDGRCKSFDARADGYGRGEGAGVVVLKHLSAALADGDSVYAVIRGTGVNQDGRTNGITVPNPHSQAALIRRVCQDAAVDPGRIVYFEAHGTGTAVGDPLEAKALGEALGRGRDADQLCVLGSVKANIGHLEAASGVAAVIKAALCLQKKQIPPLANLGAPNPNIPFAELGLRLPLKLEPINTDGGAALIGVNSFGYGGTNAHALLEEAVQAEADPASPAGEGPYFLPLSARSKPALQALAGKYADLLNAEAAPDLRDVCYSAGVRRGHHDIRCAIAADSKEALLEKLGEMADGAPGKGVAVGESLHKGQGPVFVYTGMGPQWWGMGRELYQTSAAYRQAVEACDAAFQRLAGWSILAEMLAEEADSHMAETRISQPANFLLQVGLTAMWKEKGVVPAAIVGHSVGEVTAAYAAGVLSLEDAVAVSYHRSRIQQKAAGLGAMLAVGLGGEEAAPLVDAYPGRVSIAAANSPKAVTLAGEREALEEIAAKLEAGGVFNRFLRVEVAYHSPMMDPLLPEVMESLAHIRPQAPTIPLYSTVTGRRVEGVAYDAEYWCDNVRHSVFFAKATASLLEDGHRVFLEVGPHPVLAASIKDCLAATGAQGQVVPSLRRAEPEAIALFHALGELYARGHAVAWASLYSGGGRYVKLPSYPWQRETYWHESEAARLDRLGTDAHPLLGVRMDGPGQVWSQRVNSGFVPYLPDHRVEDLLVLPGAAYVELGLALHGELAGAQAVLVENLQFRKALVIGDKEEPELRTSYNPDTREYAVHSRAAEGQPWSLHAGGVLSFLPVARRPAASLAAIRGYCPARVDGEAHYLNMAARGLQYGPSFQGLQAIWLHHEGEEVLARIEADALPEAGPVRERLHPALLDACFQALLATLDPGDRRAYVPVKIDALRLWESPGARLWCHGRRRELADGTVEGDLWLLDEDGNVQVEVLGVRAQALSQDADSLKANLDRWFYEYAWVDGAFEPAPARAPLAGRWLLLEDGAGRAEAVAKAMAAEGAELVRVRRGGRFAEHGDGSFQVSSGSPESLGQLLDRVGIDGLQGILSFWGMDAGQGGADPAGVDELASALHLVQALDGRGQIKPRLFLLTCGAQPVLAEDRHMALAQTPLAGLGRVAVNECTGLKLRMVDMDPQLDCLPLLLDELRGDSAEEEVSYRGGERYVRRLARKHSHELIAEIPETVPGAALGQLRPLNHQEFELALDGVGAQVGALGGRRPAAARLVATGVVSAVGESVAAPAVGERVLAVYQGGLGRRLVATEDDVCVLGPAAVTEDFAAQALPFIEAHYGLRHQARLAPGETVLVERADEPSGWAAVQVARSLGAVIFATAADPAQAGRLLETGVQQVFDPASADVFGSLKALTQGLGVDVAFGAFPGEYAGQALAALAPFGRLVAVAGGGPAAAPGRANRSVISLSADQLHAHRPALFKAMAQEVHGLFANRTYAPAPIRFVQAAELAKGLELADDVALMVGLDESVPLHAARSDEKPAALFDAASTYLVTGGFGGFGMETARWLARNGARHIALAGRRGAATPEAKALLADLERAGVSVLPLAADIAKEDEVVGLLRQVAASMPPLRGVIHSAAVLDDGPLNGQDLPRLAAVMAPKALGAWHLHRHTQALPLDLFVMFSSVSALVGNPGQASYCAANAFLDALAHARRADGLPAISVNWGALSEVGMVAQHSEVQEYFKRVGMGSFTPRLALDVLAQLLEWNPAQLCAANIDWALWTQYNPAWAASPRYGYLAAEAGGQGGGAGDNPFLAGLRALAEEARLDHAVETLAGLVSATMRIPQAKINRRHSLVSLGVDSLTAMELQTAIINATGAKVSALEIMKGNAIEQLAEQILAALDLDGANAAQAADIPAPPAGAEDQHQAILDKLDTLSDAEVERLLGTLIAEAGENA